MTHTTTHNVYRLAALQSTWRTATTVLQPRYQFGSENTSEGISEDISEHIEGDLTAQIGQGLVLRRGAENTCLGCNAASAALYSGGYCYRCSTTLARCDLCVVSPQRCHFHAGTCRQPAWGESFCMQPHIVYLAISSGPKVGITRQGREHSRWRDQGASQALRIVEAPTRRAAGVVEEYLSRMISDRTDWRRLVTGVIKAVDLHLLAGQLQQQLTDFSELTRRANHVVARLPEQEVNGLRWVVDAAVTHIEHPVQSYSPARRKSLAPNAEIRGNLTGILGQYLLFSSGVFNIREHQGMDVSVEFVPAIDAARLAEERQRSLFH